MSKQPATSETVDAQESGDDDWLTREEVAQELKFSSQTLCNWASQRKGPPYFKVHGQVRYRRGDLREWKKSHYCME